MEDINSVILRDFKSFAGSHKVNLAPLTILAGLNSSGKSSVIQALRIFKHCFGKDYSENYGINDIGHFDDILCDRSNTDTFSISIKIGKDNTLLDLNISENEKIDNYKDQEKLYNSFIKKTFYFISAHRLGPQVFYHTIENKKKLNEIGDNIVHFYKNHEKEKCVIIHPEAKTELLPDNLNAWMSEISPGVKLNFISNREQDTSRIAVGESGSPRKHRATNVGFGISYTLPVVLLLLCSKPGDILLIENPEAHIHPKGQSKIAQLIAMAASNGIQVIIETHSDHIINGVRVAIKQQKISNNEIAINFFCRNKENGLSEIKQIFADERGELNEWPEDFFDQSIKDLSILLSK